jgi:uncharacterized membrane protein HdeD (DUF308 family)
MDIVEKRLATILSRNWWALLLRGLIAILFGLLVWLRPGISLAALVFLFGIYALADGFLGVWTAIAGDKQQEHWWVLLLWGLVGIGVGIMTFAAPGITAVALLFYIAIWAIATGFMQIVAAVRLRREIQGEWLLVLGGLASVLFGVVLMARPIMGALAVLWLIGTYAVIFGIVLVVLAFRVRAFASRLARA